MDENKNQQPRRSLARIILPYILILAAIALFVVLIVRATSSRVVKFNSDANSVNKLLADNQIVTAEVYDKETVVQVTGSAIDSGNKDFKYTVTLNKTQYNNPFQYYENGVKKDSESYSVRFQQEIDLYKKNHPETADKAYMNEVYAFEVSWWDQWGPSIISIIVTVLIALLLFSMLSRSVNGSNSKAMEFNHSRARKVENSKVKFSDVAGCDEEKAEMEELVEYLKDPTKYTKFGAKLPKGILLVGHPGTGKTLLAKAVAGEAGVPFFSISGSDFVEMFVGVGASRVRDLFKTAKEKAPCIIFIDEIDAIGRARGKSAMSNANDERESTLNQLLTEMDGFSTNAGVIIMAATNRADVLDRALLRAGRFDRQIQVELPNLNERKGIFGVHVRKLKLGPDVDLDYFAKQTPGFSGADIANVCNEAALIAARNNKQQIEKEDFLSAVDRIIGGLERRTNVFTPEEKKIIAYHESGHATVSWLLRYASPLLKVTIVPRGKALGAAWYLPEERQLTHYDQLLDEMTSLLGGRAAEEVIFGRVSTGALNDLERVSKQAYAMIVYYGLDKKIGNVSYYDSTGQQEYSLQKPYSEKTAQEIDDRVHELIEGCYEKAKKILSDHREQLDQLAKLLIEREVIFTEDVERILGKRPFAQEEQPSQEQATINPTPTAE